MGSRAKWFYKLLVLILGFDVSFSFSPIKTRETLGICAKVANETTVFYSYIELLGFGLIVALASMILLKLSLVM